MPNCGNVFSLDCKHDFHSVTCSIGTTVAQATAAFHSVAEVPVWPKCNVHLHIIQTRWKIRSRVICGFKVLLAAIKTLRSLDQYKVFRPAFRLVSILPHSAIKLTNDNIIQKCVIILTLWKPCWNSAFIFFSPKPDHVSNRTVVINQRWPLKIEFTLLTRCSHFVSSDSIQNARQPLKEENHWWWEWSFTVPVLRINWFGY